MIADKIKDNKAFIKSKGVQRSLKSALFFTLGFLLSTGSVLETLHPFGIAAVAVSKKRYFIFTTLGALAGTLVTGLNAESARYLAAIAIASLGAFAAAAFELNARPAFSMAVSFFACFFTGAVLCLRLEATSARYILTLGESILSGGGAFFFFRAINSDYRRIRLRAMSVTDTACIMISLSLLMMNLSRLYIFLFSPARLAAVVIILCAIKYFGMNKGLICSLCFGFALGIGSESTFLVLPAFAFSAMTAALFCQFSSVAAGLSFLLSVAFFCIASGGEAALPLFCEAAFGVLVFLLLPSRLTEKLERLSEEEDNALHDGSLRQSLVLKLRFASSAMAAISESVEQVRERISEITQKENEQKRSQISEEEYIRRELVLEKTNQIRKVASDQFFSISDMLEDLAFEFDEAEIFNASASAKIRRLFAQRDIFPINISVIEDRYSRMRVEILSDGTVDGLDSPDLSREIGKICSRYFEKARITSFKNETMLSFFEKPNYSLSIGFAQNSAEGRLCGDTVKIINDGKGQAVLIISDGMGKGSRAALDGAMGAGLISKLLGAGFGFDSALKVVNCALLVKSNDESLATLDIASIDLFTGKCEIFKAGAPASYIVKNASVTKCELTSMPAGILRGIEFAKRTSVLKLDDMIIMLSDGITDLGDEWIEEQLKAFYAKTAQQCADSILQAALIKTEGARRDDMSVICARLKRN